MSKTRPDSWMPLYIGDYLADTGHLSVAEHGAYLLLIMAYWRAGGPLPDDDDQLRRICRMTAREWDSARRVVASFFDVEQGEWKHGRIDLELHAAAKVSSKRKAAANARWKQEQSKSNASAYANGHAKEPECISQSQSQSQSQTEEPLGSSAPHIPPTAGNANGRKNNGTRLINVSTFEPDDEDREYAIGEGHDPDRILADIQAWAANAKPASKALKRNPKLFWQSWCRREADNRRSTSGVNGSGRQRGHGREPDGIMAAAARVIARRSDRA